MSIQMTFCLGFQAAERMTLRWLLAAVDFSLGAALPPMIKRQGNNHS